MSKPNNGKLPAVHSRERGNVVASWELAIELREALNRIDKIESFSPTGITSGRSGGARHIVAERAAQQNGLSPDAYYRRTYSVLAGEVVATEATIAEKLLIAADVTHSMADIVEMPGCKEAAYEMIDVHLEMQGETMSAEDREQLANTFVRFAAGYCYEIDGAIGNAIGQGLRRMFGVASLSCAKRKEKRELEAMMAK